MSAGEPLARGAGDVRRDRDESTEAREEWGLESAPLDLRARSSSDRVWSMLAQ